MSRRRPAVAAAAAAGALGVAAGIAELVAGATAWTGDKDDPTTLGWVSVGLGVVLGAAAPVVRRARGPAALLAAAVVVLVTGLVGLTTAGLAWAPAAAAAAAAALLVVREVRRTGSAAAVLQRHWPDLLVGTLGVVPLALGVVAGGATGAVGVAGAAATFGALAVHARSRAAAATLLVLGAAPFAVVTWWTLVTPLTAVLTLAIGLPHVLRTRGAQVTILA